jgi:hypothetical protein
MIFPLHDILESKRVLRRKLASLLIAEKLQMLDAMRERATMIRVGPNSDEIKKVPPSRIEMDAEIKVPLP